MPSNHCIEIDTGKAGSPELAIARPFIRDVESVEKPRASDFSHG